MDWSASIDPVWLAGGAALIALLALLLAVQARLRIRVLKVQVSEARRDHQRLSNSMLALHGAMKVIAEDVISHDQHQSRVRRTLDRLSDQQSELRLRDVDEGLYGQAIELIRHGRGRDEVRKLCALTPSEVDLLFSLHGARAARDARPPP
ncbi:hypothetical protein CKO27_03510 [Thiocystis violacea]|nr:DUF2802 domain-containing protein [Thiocystis violacea]MBK1716727.1 hypothetical protein [Thiocystis violacea]